MPRDRAACHRPDLEATIRAFSHRKLGVHTRSVLLHARPFRYAEAARACCVLRASDLSDKGGTSGGGNSGDGGGGASGDGGDGGGRERNGGDLSGLAICHYVPCRSAASLSGLAVTLCGYIYTVVAINCVNYLYSLENLSRTRCNTSSLDSATASDCVDVHT